MKKIMCFCSILLFFFNEASATNKTYLLNAGGLISAKFGKLNFSDNKYNFKSRLNAGIIGSLQTNHDTLINLDLITIAEIPKDFGVFSCANYKKEKHEISVGFGFQKANCKLNDTNFGISGWAVLIKYDYVFNKNIKFFAIYRLAKLQNFGFNQISIGSSYYLI